jgi:hypothetical protein
MDQNVKRPGLPGRFHLGFQIIFRPREQLGSRRIEDRWAEFHVIDFTTLTVIPA